MLTLKYNREVIVTQSFNESTLDIYVQPQDTEYVYTGPPATSIDQSRRLLRPKSGGSIGSFSRLAGDKPAANYNLTWEVIDESSEHVDIQLTFE